MIRSSPSPCLRCAAGAIVVDRIADRALFLVLASNITHWKQQLRKACSDRDVRTVGREAAGSLLGPVDPPPPARWVASVSAGGRRAAAGCCRPVRPARARLASGRRSSRAPVHRCETSPCWTNCRSARWHRCCTPPSGAPDPPDQVRAGRAIGLPTCAPPCPPRAPPPPPPPPLTIAYSHAHEHGSGTPEGGQPR
jgi:hypothetical protein